MLRFEEILVNRIVEKLNDRLIVAAHIQQAAGLIMHAELRPTQHFKEFFHRSDTPRQSDKTIGQLRHHGFALVHRLHDPQL